MTNAAQVSNNCAMYAQLEYTDTKSDSPFAMEWFQFNAFEKDRTEHTYKETRYVYPDRAVNEAWEKVLHVGRERYLSRGRPDIRMQSIPITDVEKDGKVIYRNTPLFHVPDVFALSLMTGGQFMARRDQRSHLDRMVNFLWEEFSEKETDAGFVGSLGHTQLPR